MNTIVLDVFYSFNIFDNFGPNQDGTQTPGMRIAEHTKNIVQQTH